MSQGEFDGSKISKQIVSLRSCDFGRDNRDLSVINCLRTPSLLQGQMHHLPCMLQEVFYFYNKNA